MFYHNILKIDLNLPKLEHNISNIFCACLRFVAMTGTMVITVNYRLDVFGNLYLKNSEGGVSGNQGFLDQHLALQWIHENAARFGGDASRITLLGYGQGAVLTGLHLIYEPSWPYFNQVILQSESAMNPTQLLTPSQIASDKAQDFSKSFQNCQSKISECLRNVKALDLSLSSKSYFDKIVKNNRASMGLRSVFTPTLDGKVFTENQIKSFKDGKIKKCNIMVGFNANDGASLIPLNFGLISDNIRVDKYEPRQRVNFNGFVEFLRRQYFYYPYWPLETHDADFFKVIVDEYKKMVQNPQNKNVKDPNYFYALRKLLTDEGFACPSFKFAEIISKSNPNVYFYIYNHRMGTSKWPWWYGVTKGDELAAVFAHPFAKNLDGHVSVNPWKAEDGNAFTENNRQASKEVISKWTNFIFNGDPNKFIKNGVKSNWQLRTWPRFAEEKSFFMFKADGTEVLKMTSDIREKCHLWAETIPNLIQKARKNKVDLKLKIKR